MLILDNTYRSRIDAIKTKVLEVVSPESLRELRSVRVRDCKLRWMGAGRGQGLLEIGGCVSKDDALEVYTFDIIVNLRQSSDERLVTMLHELFHLPFEFHLEWPMDTRLPAQDEAYLETVIDTLAYDFLHKHKSWCETVFENWFGFKHTDFCIAIN